MHVIVWRRLFGLTEISRVGLTEISLSRAIFFCTQRGDPFLKLGRHMKIAIELKHTVFLTSSERSEKFLVNSALMANMFYSL